MDSQANQTSEELEVFSSRNRNTIITCSLVLSAKSINHRIQQHDDGSASIYVAAAERERAMYQLHCYFAENSNWPPIIEETEQTAHSAVGATIMLVGALALFFLTQTGPWRQHSFWFQAGAGNAEAILKHGEWYRLVTALTLHADLSHLAGNCLIGGFLVYFFFQIHGAGLGLLALLLSAAAGNYINVLAHGSDHIFVGFSTAVFSTIGMLSMHQVIKRRQFFGIRVLVPFMAGAALLAMLGSSGERTDLGSHLFGLISGLIFGLLLETNLFSTIRTSPFLQVCCLIGGICLVLFSWSTPFSTTF
ncbi:MAG: rhomboid family intramembrane serine protease [Desulfobacterales bacterium]|nr:rhomboid family intramembrane serine protease [Deltaproteobacteria bacterium]NNK97085.1 rhomboid family intramembrane serine protease [Desulfobacterales bacterium]